MAECELHSMHPGRISGTSPSFDQYYVLVMFDISEAKKYRALMRTLKKYGTRIQKSVFEAQLTKRQLADMNKSIKRIMDSERYFSENDNVRVYRIAGNCEGVVFGRYTENFMEENIIL